MSRVGRERAGVAVGRDITQPHNADVRALVGWHGHALARTPILCWWSVSQPSEPWWPTGRARAAVTYPGLNILGRVPLSAPSPGFSRAGPMGHPNMEHSLTCIVPVGVPPVGRRGQAPGSRRIAGFADGRRWFVRRRGWRKVSAAVWGKCVGHPVQLPDGPVERVITTSTTRSWSCPSRLSEQRQRGDGQPPFRRS